MASCAHHRLRSAVLHDAIIGAAVRLRTGIIMTIIVELLTAGHYRKRSTVLVSFEKLTKVRSNANDVTNNKAENIHNRFHNQYSKSDKLHNSHLDVIFTSYEEN